MISAGSKIKVYLEFEDGRIAEVNGSIDYLTMNVVAKSLEDDGAIVSASAAYSRNATIEISGDFFQYTREAWDRVLEARRSSREWLCPYCGRPNNRNDETCKSCSAVRSFIYD